MKRRPYQPTIWELRDLYEAVRAYCKKERADVPASSPEMVKAWLDICRRVRVRARR